MPYNGPGAEAVSEFTDKSSCEAQNLSHRKMWFRSTKPLMAFAPCYRAFFLTAHQKSPRQFV